jgi:HPt (histidine-containing phosphotransfer) domain-containing protein
LKENNLKSVAEDVHKIKHKISILGMEKGHKLASDYEENLKNNSTELSNDFENILHSISVFLDDI